MRPRNIYGSIVSLEKGSEMRFVTVEDETTPIDRHSSNSFRLSERNEFAQNNYMTQWKD